MDPFHGAVQSGTIAPMASFGLDIEFRNGWCYLHLCDGDSAIDIETSYLSDGFSEFLDATQSLLSGCKSASAVWGHDDVGGYFLDFVSDPHGGINIAVHETERGYAASDVETMWSAARGQCRFSTRVPIGDFARTVAAALRRVRVNAVDATGAIEQWFFTFPQAAYERIERLAQRRGYDPARAVRDTR